MKESQRSFNTLSSPLLYVGFHYVPSLLTMYCILTIIPTPPKNVDWLLLGVCSVDSPGQHEKADKVARTLTFGVQGPDTGRVCAGKNLVE